MEDGDKTESEQFVRDVKITGFTPERFVIGDRTRFEPSTLPENTTAATPVDVLRPQKRKRVRADVNLISELKLHTNA